MFKRISASIVGKAVENGIIEPERTDENIYGVNAMLTIAVNIVTAALIGIVFNMLCEMAVFILFYKILRRYIGGSHEKTAVRCYIASCVLYGIVIAAIRFYPFSGWGTTLLMLGSSGILFALAPVEAVNKPLDDIERKVFRRRSRITIIAVLLVYMALRCIPNGCTDYYSVVVAVSVFAVTVFAVEGKLKLKHEKGI